MFKNEYQGGNFFEIFNPSLKDPLVNCRVVGSHGIQKSFDKEVKGSIFHLEGTPTITKICLPKESKLGLSLIQRILVFQLNVKQNSEFSLEIGITDLSQNRRSLSFSTSHKELNTQPLSARIPIKSINRAQWTNFVFDLSSLINELWKGQTFKSIESISICANCKVRKIFTLKNLPTAEFGLIHDESLNSVDFPEGTDSKTHLFNINETKTNLDASSSNEQSLSSSDPSNATGRAKSQSSNVFKIAFGSKVSKMPPLNSPKQMTNSQQLVPQQQAQNSSFSLLKSSNSQPQLHEHGDSLNNSLKSNMISPLSFSNGNVSSTDTNGRKSSASNNKQKDETSAQAKTNWIQKAQNSTTSTTSARVENPSTDVTQLLDLQSVKPANKQQTPANESHMNNDQTLAGKTNNNKIPHPPPPSTRPSLSSARKIRLPLNGAKNASNTDYNNNTNGKLPTLKQTYDVAQSPMLVNEEDVNNHSTKTIIDLIQPNVVKLNNVESVSNAFQDSLNDSAPSNVVYSFSSKPKPVSSSKDNHHHHHHHHHNHHQISPNRKSTSQASSKQHISATNSVTQAYDHRKYTQSTSQQQSTLITSVNENNNNNNINNGFDLMDSFEARMLQEMKAEMEAEKQQNIKLFDAHAKLNSFGTSLGSPPAMGPSANNDNRTIDAGMEEPLQRESSGVHTPLSDDGHMDNHTTSEKFNFDAVTSSIEDTTTSISKKAINRKFRNDDATNNYQDEMNISLLSNLPGKSINLKDLPSKYSPLLSQQNNQSNKNIQSPISEEPTQYDDSQADIDEIISDSDDEIDLLYDPSLNCYYDPKTGTYYEIALDR